MFFDDILIYSRSVEEHAEHLRPEHKFYAKLSKCAFAMKSVQYLGHIISSDGVSVDPEKFEAIIG